MTPTNLQVLESLTPMIVSLAGFKMEELVFGLEPLPPGVYGYYAPMEKPRIVLNLLDITMGAPVDHLVWVFCHELGHHEQFASGRMSHSFDSRGKHTTTFEGVTYSEEDINAIWDSGGMPPWELDANRYADRLFAQLEDALGITRQQVAS